MDRTAAAREGWISDSSHRHFCRVDGEASRPRPEMVRDCVVDRGICRAGLSLDFAQQYTHHAPGREISIMALADCKILDLPKIQDPRGNLTFVEG